MLLLLISLQVCDIRVKTPVIAEDGSHLQPMAGEVGFGARDGHGTSRLENGARLVEDILDCCADGAVVDQDNTVDQVSAHAEGLHAHLRSQA